jgi:16S rRNA (cytosine967-C5)-methyltransferase
MRRHVAGSNRRHPSKPRSPTARAPSSSKTRARGAEGRERSLGEQGASPSWLTLALDAIQRHRATGFPLDKTLAELVRARHAGTGTRRAAADALFAWARQRTSIEREVDDAIAREGGIAPRRRQRDHAAVLLAVSWSDLELPHADDAALPDVLALLVDAVARGEMAAPPATLPAWLTARLAQVFGDETQALTHALMQRAPVTLAVDTRHVDEARVIDALRAFSVDATPSPLLAGAIRCSGRVPLSKLHGSIAPHVWPMDDGSQLVALALGVEPGEIVLDLCAGGGGKTRLLASTGVRVIAADSDRTRIGSTHKRAPDVGAVRSLGQAPPFVAGSFDRVLVDAPCSGTGTLRRAPDLAARLDESVVTRYPPLQQELLSSALDLVKRGGTVIYATCSLLSDENDAVIDAVLRARPDAHAIPLAALSRARAPEIRAMATRERAMFLPTTHGTDGFFIAALTRR